MCLIFAQFVHHPQGDVSDDLGIMSGRLRIKFLTASSVISGPSPNLPL